MAAYTEYPTPPPTSSPKHASSNYPFTHSPPPRVPAQHSYYQDTQPPPRGPSPPHIMSSYQPTSPTQWDPPPNNNNNNHQTPFVINEKPHPTVTTTTTYEYLPPHQKPSPTPERPPLSARPSINTIPSPDTSPYYDDPPLTNGNTNGPVKPGRQSTITFSTHQPGRTQTPPLRRRTPPRPIYFSPSNPVPSPYNVSRPTPRPGFLKRMLLKIKSWLKNLMTWARKNPIKAGFLSFLPILAGAGLVKLGSSLGLGTLIKESGVGKFVGMIGGGVIEGMGGGKPKDKESKKAKDGDGKGKKEEGKKPTEWGYGMDHFTGFGGTKTGPLDGIMKVALLGINHYCRLTPSAMPRMASILLELYFLDPCLKKL